jgi:hypothetical protein
VESLLKVKVTSLTYNLLKEGNGFVILKDNKKYQLPPPMEKSGERIYSLAVTHQLHCLVYLSIAPVIFVLHLVAPHLT